MAQFGSNRSIIAQNQSAVTDPNGNLIVSPDDSWQGSPLGVAARNQVTIGVPNGTFNLLPANPVATIDSSNPLPYWDLVSDDGFTSTMSFDTTTQTWSVQIDPTAVTTVPGTAILKTRIPITNDDGLDVRHFVASSLIQAVKVAGADKWVAKLTSQYYDTTGAAIGTPYIIGTVGERGTATVISSYTNASGPISTSAAELELAYSLVAGTASSTYTLKVKSAMVATEYGVIGGGAGAYVPLSTVTTKGDLIVASGNAAVSRLGTAAEGAYLQVDSGAANGLSWKAFPNDGVGWVVQTFAANGTWIKPAGVNYVTVVAMGGGAGGASGAAAGSAAINSLTGAGGAGGATGSWAILNDIYVTGNVSVGVGAGGSGGSATVTTKATTVTTQFAIASVAGASGAASTFGSYLSVGGGGGTAVTSTYFGSTAVAGTAGGASGNIGSTHAISAFTSGAPYTTFAGAGIAGTAGTATGSSSDAAGTGGTANAASGLGGGGGGGGGGVAFVSNASTGANGNRGGSGGSGSGGGGAASSARALLQTIVTSGGPGAAGSAGSGSGGGGGGGAAISSSTAAIYNSAAFTLTTGKGGNGGDGFVAVAYQAIDQ